MIGMLLGRILAALGHEVCAVVATEAAAVAAAADRLPDLMVVDVNLACGSGQGAVDAINRLQVIPYVFTTGNALALQRERPEAVVIQKPFDEAQLTAAMARALAGS